jgi:hypothetical protein
MIYNTTDDLLLEAFDRIIVWLHYQNALLALLYILENLLLNFLNIRLMRSNKLKSITVIKLRIGIDIIHLF